MAEDWSLDVKKYVPMPDEAAIVGIIRHCGIALQSHDASLVAFSDKSETDRVRESFLKKKLALTDPDPVLDDAIASVGERMKADHTKNRVTVYYLLAEHFGKLGLFSKSASVVEPITGASGVPITGTGLGAEAAALGAAGLAGVGTAAAGLGSAGESVVRPVASLEGAGMAARSGIAGLGGDVEEEASGAMRWWPWLLLALLVLAVLWYLFAYRHAETPPAPAPTSDVSAPAVPAAVPATSAAVTIPAGAGVTSETRDGKPFVTVYFDTGKADVVPAFGDAAAALKTYLDANAGSSLTVSGFNDKTGNAAANAELSKHRAQAVQAALVAAKIPDTAIALQKPSDTTDTSTSNAAARRVEVAIK